MYCYDKNPDMVSDLNLLMIPIFYIGDCILYKLK
nr:MAG TPA: hypothetical protein [Caudoviricetes sp.]